MALLRTTVLVIACLVSDPSRAEITAGDSVLARVIASIREDDPSLSTDVFLNIAENRSNLGIMGKISNLQVHSDNPDASHAVTDTQPETMMSYGNMKSSVLGAVNTGRIDFRMTPALRQPASSSDGVFADQAQATHAANLALNSTNISGAITTEHGQQSVGSATIGTMAIGAFNAGHIAAQATN